MKPGASKNSVENDGAAKKNDHEDSYSFRLYLWGFSSWSVSAEWLLFGDGAMIESLALLGAVP